MPPPHSTRLPANVWVLAATQSIGMSTVSMMALVSGLLGTAIAPTPKLATLPTAMIVVGTATSMLWVPLLLQKWGRKRGTLVGFAAAFLAIGLGATAAMHESFLLLLVCGYGMGIGIAFWQQMRFAALESVDDPQRYGSVLTVIMTGGLASAFFGPELGALGRDLLPQPFAGSFILVAGLLVIGLIIFQFFREPPRRITTDSEPARSLSSLVRTPRFLIASLAAASGFGVMSFIMTATPINMNELCGIGLDDTKHVIQSHIVAMFAPSLVSGWLIGRFGISRLLAIGAALFATVVFIGLRGQHLVHFWGSLVLLGIGWNFLFVGGTALLPTAYRPAERFKAQAINDVVVFGTQAIASLSAGWFLFSYGWNIMLYSCVPILLGAFGLSIWLRKLERAEARLLQDRVR
ncbi:MAG: MFS transporter [Opitutaceae bacterium]|nr:MFS transporter [Opitutaceae bacterium]MBP9911852.1 MFS transporter [Opitutaceae bacterium]